MKTLLWGEKLVTSATFRLKLNWSYKMIRKIITNTLEYRVSSTRNIECTFLFIWTVCLLYVIVKKKYPYYSVIWLRLHVLHVSNIYIIQCLRRKTLTAHSQIQMNSAIYVSCVFLSHIFTLYETVSAIHTQSFYYSSAVGLLSFYNVTYYCCYIIVIWLCFGNTCVWNTRGGDFKG